MRQRLEKQDLHPSRSPTRRPLRATAQRRSRPRSGSRRLRPARRTPPPAWPRQVLLPEPALRTPAPQRSSPRPGGTAESASPTRTPPRLRPRLARPRASPDRPNARALPQTAPGPPNCVVFACPRHRRHELHGARWGWRTGYAPPISTRGTALLAHPPNNNKQPIARLGFITDSCTAGGSRSAATSARRLLTMDWDVCGREMLPVVRRVLATRAYSGGAGGGSPHRSDFSDPNACRAYSRSGLLGPFDAASKRTTTAPYPNSIRTKSL